MGRTGSTRPWLLVLVLLAVVAVAVNSAAASADTQTVDARLTANFVTSYSITQARTYLNGIQADGTWSDVDYTAGCSADPSSWPALTHLTRVLKITQAWYAVPALRTNATVLDGIMRGLDYWLDNDYANEFCTNRKNTTACPCSTPGLWNTNWWSNMIGAQLQLGPTCLLLRSASSSVFTADHKSRCAKILGRANWTGFTGANTLWLAQGAVYAGLLTQNDTAVAAAFAASNNELYYSPGSDDGIKPDGSFLQHKALLYTGGYGDSFAATYVDMFVSAVGTAFASTAAQREVFARFVLDGLQWMVVYSPGKNLYDPSVVGRAISRKVGLVASLDTNSLTNLTAGWSRQKEFEAFVEVVTSNDGSRLVGNRMYWAADYMVHRRAHYVVSVKGFSTRIANSECVNSENLLGLHLSDGAMYVHQSGNEYGRVNGSADRSVFPLWDWNHVPGITVDYGVGALTCASLYAKGQAGGFVGGASDGTYGAFAMRFVSPFTRNLSFQKAWFMFDDEVVVLAANITSVDPAAAVHSVLDAKVLNGPVTSSVGGAGAPIAVGSSTSQPWWLHHDSVGYVFPENRGTASGPLKLHLETASASSGSWSAIGEDSGTIALPTFNAWLTRQSAPVVNDSLAYVVVPGVSAAAFDPAATLAAVEVVANTPHVQAVFHTKLRLLGAAFWSTTEADQSLQSSGRRGWRVRVDQPCVVLVQEVDDGARLKVTVSDPTQALSGVKVTIDRAVACAACLIASDQASTTLSFSLTAGSGASASTTVTATDASAASTPGSHLSGLIALLSM